ncbi:hypothetical protein L596_021684 [Steinernema carpocapsae]|uniref:Uncharacterized protein n=1 Tax=Steinernema carpocapsae TaxID=34508 RepID=A0A4U5MJG8_STECR|nr:hypothetical protein L596_021684 [Steinernema carpocapsae]
MTESLSTISSTTPSSAFLTLTRDFDATCSDKRTVKDTHDNSDTRESDMKEPEKRKLSKKQKILACLFFALWMLFWTLGILVGGLLFADLARDL